MYMFFIMNKDIAKILKERRRLLGIDQKTLARISGVSVHALSDLETGKGNPTLATVLQVLNALGLTLMPTITSPEDHDA
jgi:y4mF family transcriptional regulator